MPHAMQIFPHATGSPALPYTINVYPQQYNCMKIILYILNIHILSYIYNCCLQLSILCCITHTMAGNTGSSQIKNSQTNYKTTNIQHLVTDV